MNPSQVHFKDAMKALRVRLCDRVIVYDNKGTLQSTRAYWMFTLHGHANVQVLSGGLKKWVAEGRITEKEEAGTENDYDYKENVEMVKNIEQMHEAVVARH